MPNFPNGIFGAHHGGLVCQDVDRTAEWLIQHFLAKELALDDGGAKKNGVRWLKIGALELHLVPVTAARTVLERLNFSPDNAVGVEDIDDGKELASKVRLEHHCLRVRRLEDWFLRLKKGRVRILALPQASALTTSIYILDEGGRIWEILEIHSRPRPIVGRQFRYHLREFIGKICGRRSVTDCRAKLRNAGLDVDAQG